MSKWKPMSISPGNMVFPGIKTEGDDVTLSFSASPEEKCLLVLADPTSGRKKQKIELQGEFRRGSLVSVRIKGFLRKNCGYYFEINGRKVKDPSAHLIRNELCFVSGNDTILEKDSRPVTDPSDRLIYKLHVKGFTMQESSLKCERGTFKALEKKLDYIRELGFNTIELMPCYEWEKREGNYWGYASTNYYSAPRGDFAAGSDASAEMKELILAMHQKGILCYLEFHIPYGTNPIIVLNALHRWYDVYHADGFRFLGSGVPQELILSDPYLRQAALIFEHVSERPMSFEPVTDKPTVFYENDDFMLTARGFLKGDKDLIGNFVSLMLKHPGNFLPVNCLANVNGFTLRDTVTYNQKHNENNGENNRDGSDDNKSWNCGIEGPTRRPKIEALRRRQIKNALAYLFLSQGIPLLMAGDEMNRTQLGNNNAYNQDNSVSWLSWKKTKSVRELQNYIRQLIRFRKAHPILHCRQPLRENDARSLGYPDVSFHDHQLWYSLFESDSRSIGLLYNEAYAEEAPTESRLLFVILNSDWKEQNICIPGPPEGQTWQVVLNTAAESGREFETQLFDSDNVFYAARPRSVTILQSRTEE